MGKRKGVGNKVNESDEVGLLVAELFAHDYRNHRKLSFYSKFDTGRKLEIFAVNVRFNSRAANVFAEIERGNCVPCR